MAEVTVKQLAKQVGIPVDRLLSQLGESGLPHSEADESINEKDRMQLLNYLRRLQGKEPEGADSAAPKKIVLKRKAVSELKVTGQRGGRKAVTVEVRKRRAVRTPAAAPGEEASAASPAVADPSAAAPSESDLEAAKQALHDEAKRRNEELDGSIRADTEAREKAELLKPKPKPKPKVEPQPEPAPATPAQTAVEEVAKPAEQAPTVAPVPPPGPAEVSAPKSADTRKPDHRRPDRPARGKPARGAPRRGDREELHVASDKRGRRRKKPAKSRAVWPAPQETCQVTRRRCRRQYATRLPGANRADRSRGHDSGNNFRG